MQRRVRPEVAEPDFWAKLVEAEYGTLVARQKSEGAQVRETSVVAEESDETANVALAFASENEPNADFADEPPTDGARGQARGLDAASARKGGAFKSERSLASTGNNAGQAGSKTGGQAGSNAGAQAESKAGSNAGGQAGGKEAVAHWRPVGLDDGEGGEAGASANDAARSDLADWENDNKENVAERTKERENGRNLGDSAISDDAAEEGAVAGFAGSDDEVGAENEAVSDVADENDAEPDESAPLSDSEGTTDAVDEEEKENRVNLNGFYLNDIQVYLIICAIFCLFYNAARLMTDSELKSERKRKGRAGRGRASERRGD